MRPPIVVLVMVGGLGWANAQAVTTQFFAPTQVATPVASGATWDSISSNGYVFKFTRDKLFTGGIGPNPIGRPVRVPWPSGVEAQAVTAGPSTSGARIDLSRSDGSVFDLPAFSAKLLANTAGAGGSIEIMPKVNGEDAFGDPLAFQASGSAGNVFSYSESTPSYIGNTLLLKGFTSYTIGLYVDFALTALTLIDPSAPPVLIGDFNADGFVDAADYVVARDGLGTIYTEADLADWRANFGATAAGGTVANGVTSAVPEPLAATWITLIAYGVAASRRRQQDF